MENPKGAESITSINQLRYGLPVKLTRDGTIFCGTVTSITPGEFTDFAITWKVEPVTWKIDHTAHFKFKELDNLGLELDEDVAQG